MNQADSALFDRVVIILGTEKKETAVAMFE